MATKKTKAKKIKASDMLFLAIIAYLCQLAEPVLKSLIIDTPVIDYIPLGNTVWTLILRALCCVIWALALGLIIKSSKNCGFNPLKTEGKLSGVQWLLTIVGALIFISVLIALDGSIKAVFERFSNIGNFIETVTYFIFLAFQVALIVITLALGQKFGDLVFTKGNKFVPYGGIVLGVCMMVTNLITGGLSLNAVLVFGIQLIYGMIFVFSGKKSLIAAPFIYLMFVML